MFIIENDMPANRLNGRICLAVMYLEFDNFSYVMYILTHHGYRHDARDLIEYPWSVLKLSVSLIMNHNWWFISKQSGLRPGPKF